MSRPASNLLPYAALIAAIVAFCGGTSFAKRLFPLVGAEGTTAYRVGFSALLLLVAMRPWRFALARRDAGRLLCYGLALGAMNLSFYMALRTLPLGPAIAIEFLGPLAVALAHARRVVHVALAGLAVAGLWLLLPVHGGARPLDPVGIGFAFGAATGWACYILAGRRTGHLPAGQAVALGMVAAALLVVPIGIAHAGATLLTPSWLGMGVIAALLSSAIPYSLEMIALQRIPPHSLGVLLSLEPVVGALAGVALLGETLSLTQWGAIAMVVAASIGVIVTTPDSKQEVAA